MSRIHPFQNEAELISFGGFTIENTVYWGGNDLLQFGCYPCSKPGLTIARQLKELIDLVVKALEGDKDSA